MAKDVDTSSLRLFASRALSAGFEAGTVCLPSTCVGVLYEWHCPRLSVAAQADGTLVNGRSGQPSVRASVGTAQSATTVPRNANIPEEQSSSRPECEAVDLETILKERDACGVGHVFVGYLLAPSFAGIVCTEGLARDLVL